MDTGCLFDSQLIDRIVEQYTNKQKLIGRVNSYRNKYHQPVVPLQTRVFEDLT